LNEFSLNYIVGRFDLFTSSYKCSFLLGEVKSKTKTPNEIVGRVTTNLGSILCQEAQLFLSFARVNQATR